MAVDEKQVRADIFSEEKKKCVAHIAKFEIDIHVLERTDPKAVIAKQALKKDADGNVLSSRDITAKDTLEDYRKQKESYEKRLGVLNNLLEENSKK